MGTEETLNTFRVDAFVPTLVGLLNMEENPEIMHILFNYIFIIFIIKEKRKFSIFFP
jgi:hypothetical protein